MIKRKTPTRKAICTSCRNNIINADCSYIEAHNSNHRDVFICDSCLIEANSNMEKARIKQLMTQLSPKEEYEDETKCSMYANSYDKLPKAENNIGLFGLVRRNK